MVKIGNGGEHNLTTLPKGDPHAWFKNAVVQSLMKLDYATN